jgi:hypothetical protein
MSAAAARPDLRSLISRANLLLPGLYAWVATVAHPASLRSVSTSARVTAMLALAALVVGPVLAQERPVLARAAGVYVFSGLCLVTWILAGGAMSPDTIDPVRAALGALGWMLHAFGWGATRRLLTVPEDDPNVIGGPPLAARGRLPNGTTIVFSIGVAGAILLLVLAWRVNRPEHALFAHAVAIGASILVVRAAAEIALDRGQKRLFAPAPARLNAAVLALASLTLALGLGFIWLLLS